jgi:RNA polymerase sigma-70 factor, ECF subfamily
LQQAQFIELINQHQQIIHKVCSVYVNNPVERQDIFQEVLLQAWKSVDNFKGNAKFSTWLYRVALNTAITFYRKEKKSPLVNAFTSLPEVADEVDASKIEQSQFLYAAIADLNNIDKALVLLYLEDYSYDEIGEIMGITANNVAVKMNRIKTKLKTQKEKAFAEQ